MTELFDIYDENLQHIGVKPRAEVHRDGDWHLVFHCHVIYRDNAGDDWMILQKRAPDKDTFPGLLDVSVGGHYEHGETMQDGVREISEELGLRVAFEDLIPAGKRVSAARGNTFIDREFADVFFYICDKPLADYQYQKEEIMGLIALHIREGIQLLTGQCDALDVPATGFATDMIRIEEADFIPTLDDYFYKALLLAQRVLDGETYLRI
ncbi:MAG: NUDIX hydrolase [Aggregatilineales bacterium]